MMLEGVSPRTIRGNYSRIRENAEPETGKSSACLGMEMSVTEESKSQGVEGDEMESDGWAGARSCGTQQAA